MAFGPIIGGSGGGGASPTAPIFLTHTTGDIDPSNAVDIDLALPAGVTRCTVIGAAITTVSGISTRATVTAHFDDARSGTPQPPIYIFGSSLTASNVPYAGPASPQGSDVTYCAPHYKNLDGSEFLRLTLANNAFDEDPSSFKLDLIVLPLPPLAGEI